MYIADNPNNPDNYIGPIPISFQSPVEWVTLHSPTPPIPDEEYLSTLLNTTLNTNLNNPNNPNNNPGGRNDRNHPRYNNNNNHHHIFQDKHLRNANKYLKDKEIRILNRPHTDNPDNPGGSAGSELSEQQIARAGLDATNRAEALIEAREFKKHQTNLRKHLQIDQKNSDGRDRRIGEDSYVAHQMEQSRLGNYNGVKISENNHFLNLKSSDLNRSIEGSENLGELFRKECVDKVERNGGKSGSRVFLGYQAGFVYDW